MVAVDRIQGLSGSRAIKTPVRVATAGAIALSGEQTVDGVAVVEGDRVLVNDQAVGEDNGIYDVSTGAWTRAIDFDGANDITQGTLVAVVSGATYGDKIFSLDTADPVIGTSALSFTPVLTLGTFPISLPDGGTGASDASGARTALGLVIGTNVQAYDADTLKSDTTKTLTAGYTATDYDAGTKSTGTFTPDPALGNFQKVVNNGAHTLAPPSSSCTMIIQVTNGASAGTITTSGFTKVTGTAPGTTNGDDFLAFITRVNGLSHLAWQALQ